MSRPNQADDLKRKTQDRLEELASKAQTYYSKNKSAHQWDHVMRVSVTAEQIALTQQDVDMEILHAMVYLHDIVRYEDEREDRNLKESIKLAGDILRQLNYSPDFINKVEAGIASHSMHQSGKIQPQSIEAKILYDADKIDAVGPIGIARWMMVQSNKNNTIKNAADLYLQNVKRLSGGERILFTDEGNKRLHEKLNYSKRFFEDLLAGLSL